MEFLARIHKGKIRVPPKKEFRDGTIVAVTIKPVKEEKEEDLSKREWGAQPCQ